MEASSLATWTDEQSASIDWADADDVLSNGWTFLRLLDFHPALAQHASTHAAEAEAWRAVFLDPKRREEQRALLQRWLRADLLALRAARWCRRCRCEGHTWRVCPEGHCHPAGGRILARFAAHQAEVERRKLQAEKQLQQQPQPFGGLDRSGGEAQRHSQQQRQPQRPKRELALFAEERRRGTVGRIDAQYGIGFVRVADVGDVKFFMDRVDYGVKEIALGDAVTLKIDYSRDYPLAVDIRPERPNVSAEDVTKFLHRCRRTTQPITIIKAVMTHTYEWPIVLTVMQSILARGDAAGFVNGVHTLIELTTFVDNREPIHTPLLQSFLALLLKTTGKGVTSVPPFFPGLVLDALRAGEKEFKEQPTARVVDRWVETANLVVLLRQYAAPTEEDTSAVQETITSLLETGRVAVPATSKRVDAALSRLKAPSVDTLATRVIPSALDFSVPPPMPNSVFASRNLPVNGSMAATTTEKFITDHCRLLRADTFETVSRLMPELCFELPGYTPTEETKSDVRHARLFDGVCFMGRVVTRDKDYAMPDGYILRVQPRSEMADLATQLLPGVTVCITTGLDRTVIEEEEVFWAVITSCDLHLLAAGMIVVSPGECNKSFDLLVERLQRNERLGKTSQSCLLETSVFISGYRSIIKALNAFVGPLAMPLPMANLLVSPEAAAAQWAMTTTSSLSGTKMHIRQPEDLVAYIPPHCEYAFADLIGDIKSRFSLDDGQTQAMDSLSTHEILLVQGPPGTGKSFIGCRVVEVYVRYKQLIASGDILRMIDVDSLRSTSAEDMLPTVGPIVVITYKNHALDEFLVDLLQSGLWDDERNRIAQQLIGAGSHSSSSSIGGGLNGLPASTSNRGGVFPRGKRIIRIGGRSREPALEAYNLSNLVRGKTEKPVLNSLKERIYLMNQRLERLLKEIHYLESGRVPKTLFERWLTEEQRKHIRYEDREDWLLGKQYVGPTAALVERTHYLNLLRTQMAISLEAAQQHSGASSPVRVKVPLSTDEVHEEAAPLSVFQEMRREEESREYNNTLHTMYLSAEALALARGSPQACPANVPEGLLSLWSLNPLARHEYYAYLIRECIAAKARDSLVIMDAIINVITIRNHAMDEVRLDLLQGADVIGLTTTGCAMNQNLLRSLRPSVLVVEEAAEVLESQLLACMTDSLQQVVLIGDHYQLQPKVETFAYEKYNKLNLSLFERMAGRIHPICLTEQRRMHPDISHLVRPFYDTQELLDSPGLHTRPFITASGDKCVESVPGLARRAFFWRHTHPEEEAQGSRSKVNTKEVEMVVRLVQHLSNEGVHQRSITVITPYLGQFRMLRTALRMRAFKDVRVSTVDLFQGDESDVIILSMVRTERLTEFLRMRNRMIVCCSRARFAMVLVGSDALLDQCEHWKQVLDLLRREDCVGQRLPITHRTTPGEVTWMDV